jgi:putative ABC transport system substrate-binding protein
MRRREFVTLLGGPASCPLVARAQQAGVPVIGVLSIAGIRPLSLEAFRRGLSGTGYVEGRNLVVEFRFAQNRLERMPILAGELVRRQVNVIFAPNTPSALAAKAATRSIPIVFLSPSDPVENGLVASLNRPGGNLTGISSLNIAVAAKRLQLMHELLPAATSIACLINPVSSVNAEAETRELQVAARTLGVQLVVLNASGQSEFEAAFAAAVRERVGGLVIGSDPIFFGNSDLLVPLADRYRMPTIYPIRDATVAGGLMNYGTDFIEVWRQAGFYAGRILKGEKPADLPVQQVTKIELVINMKTAKALGLAFPTALLVRADEVIE